MSDYQKMTPEFFNSLPQYKRELLLIERAFDIEFESASMMAEYLVEKCDLDLQEADLHVLVEDGSYRMLDSLYREAVEKTTNSAIDAVKKMIDAVIKFIQDTVAKVQEKLTSVFTKNASKKLTAEDYLNSETMNMAVNMEYQKELAEIDKKLTEGQKLSQKIASGIGVDRGVVQGYVDTVDHYIKNLPQIAVKAVKTAAVAGMVVIAAKNYKPIAQTLAKGIEKTLDFMKSLRKNTKDKNPGPQSQLARAMCNLAKTKTTICSRISLGAASIINMKNPSGADAAKTVAAASIKKHKGGVNRVVGFGTNVAYNAKTAADKISKKGKS